MNPAHRKQVIDHLKIAVEKGWSMPELVKAYPVFSGIEYTVASIEEGIELRGTVPGARAKYTNMMHLIRSKEMSASKISQVTGYSNGYINAAARAMCIELPITKESSREPGRPRPALPAQDLPPMAPPPALQPGYKLVVKGDLVTGMVATNGAAQDATTRGVGQLASDYDILRAGLDLLYGQLDRELTDPGRTLDQRRATITQMMRVEKVREDLK